MKAGKLAIVVALGLVCGAGCAWWSSTFGGAVVELEAPDGGGSVRVVLPRSLEVELALDAGEGGAP